MYKNLLIIIIVVFIAGISLYALNAPAFISNGANALDMLGQYGDNSAIPVPVYNKYISNNNPNGFSITPHTVAVDSAGHRLFISDRDNNRIFVYNLTAGNLFGDRVPDFVIGQQNFYTNMPGLTRSSLNTPTVIVFDSVGNRLFVADTGNDRVLVFNVSTITNGMNAAKVLGQSSFTVNNSGLTQKNFSGPLGLAYDLPNKRLFVADSSNRRIMVFNVGAISNGENAVNVLGQTNFTSDNSAVTQSGMDFVTGIAYDSVTSRLFVPDRTFNRVLVFDVAGITNGENAINVLGQTDFVSSNSNLTQSGFNIPMAATYNGSSKHLFVADSGAHRVMVFDVAGTTNGENAINVLGQTDFTSDSSGITQMNLYHPRGVTFEPSNGLLYVGDSLNNREMIFDVASITNGENAVDLLGQYDDNLINPLPVFTKNDTVNKLGFTSPRSVALDPIYHRLFVSDKDNNRVLMYSLTTANFLIDRVPDKVLGQVNFYAHESTTTQSGMNSPFGLVYNSNSNQLYVADSGNNRVLVFDVASITNGENAINVLGQSDFVSGSSSLSDMGLNAPAGLAFDKVGNKLFIADQVNNRVLVFDVATITNGENAVNVLGQSDFVSSLTATNQNTLISPFGVGYNLSTNQLYVADSGNNRVLVFDVASITNGENAINVLGQGNFTSNTAGTTQNGFNTPVSVVSDSAHNRIFVTDAANHRVLSFDVASITNGENAINVLGQASFTSNIPAASQSGLNIPIGLEYDLLLQRLYVADSSNRVMIFDASYFETSTSTAPGDTIPPKITLISVTEKSSSSVLVKWTTDEPSTSIVEYGLYPDITMLAPSDINISSQMVTKHEITLTGLSAYTRYAFKVRSRDASGNESVSTDKDFRTTQ